MGLGDFTRRQHQAIGLGTIAAVGGSLAMSMAPNTMSAVTQRMYADSMAGLSGMGAQGLISQSNRLVGGGATSAMGPTAAAATLGYQGGYLANTLSSKRIMQQLGGMSAITGASNEQVAGAFAGINAMTFLRGGIRARDRQGNLVAPNQLINQAFRFLYGGRAITKEQAMMVLNPGSKGYATLMQLSGGDPELMRQLQMGVISRASKGANLTKKDLSDPNRALDLMGVGKESPIRSQFRYNTSEARKLEATEAGLVGGYNVGLRTTASVNDAFSTMADILGPVNDGLMTLKGILQTMPGAGNTGATLSSLGGMAMGAGASALQLGLTARMLGVGGAKGFMGTGALAAGGTAATMGAGTAAAVGAGTAATGAAAISKKAALLKLLKSTKGKLTIGSIAAVLGAEGLDALFGNKVGSGTRRAGLAAANTGGLALTGAAIGSFIMPGLGTGIGALIGTGIGLGQTLMAGMGGGDCNHGNMGCSHGIGGDDSSGKAFQLPVPKGTPVSSPFGPRPDAAKRNPGISSNHSGVDYALSVGSPVLAAADGIVSETGNHPKAYGYYVIIKHAKKSTMYAHLSHILVRKGQEVKRGQQIAKSGGKKGARGAGNSTGPHLHFEIRDHGGVGAGGRQNPQGFFGRAFSFIKNVVGKGVSSLKTMAGRIFGSNSDIKNSAAAGVMPGSDVGSPISQRLSSPSISQLLAMFGGGAVNYKRITSGINKNSKKYRDNFNTSHDESAQGEGGIAGGSRAGLMRMLYEGGFRGDALKTAFAVALAESGGRSGAIGDESLADNIWGPSYGVFQIRSLKNWRAYNDPYRDATRLRDPRYNIQAALVKSKQGTNWKPWSAYKNGAFTKFLDDADRIAGKSGIGGGDASGMTATNLAATETGGSSTAVMRGNTSVNASSKVNVSVNMNVQIARASLSEANKLADDVLKRLEKKLKYGEGIGTY
jgi:murein DD-endopeptidase MepM/ murein hydrolase activator NlpD